MDEADTRAAVTSGSPSHKLARNAFFLLVGQVGSSVISVILTAVLGRWLGVVEFGIYYYLVAVSTFAYVFIDWGQSAYLTIESARRPEDDSQLLGGALAFRAAVAVVVALATAELVKVIGYDSRTEFLALLAVLCGLPLALSQAYVYIFRGRDRMDLDATTTVTGKALTVAVTVPALFLGGGLIAVLLMQAVGGAGALLVAVLVARKIRLKAKRPGRGILQELANRGGPIAVFSIAAALQTFVDIIVLSKFVPPEVVGWYGAARNIMGVLFAPAAILSTASFPELSRTSGSLPGLRHVLRATSRLLLGLGALAAAGTFLFADVAVGLIYGHHFDPAVAVLQVFAPIFPLFFMDMLLGIAIIAAGKTKEMAVVKVLSIAVSTGLSIVLIPVCQARLGNGGVGSVLAFGSTEILMLAAFLWLLPRGAVDRSTLLDFLRAAAAAGGTVGIFWVLPTVTPWLAVPACVAVFTALALATGLVLRTDLDKVAVLSGASLRGWRSEQRRRASP
jgi:O-antigen/teichoic acid export membrane protein